MNNLSKRKLIPIASLLAVLIVAISGGLVYLAFFYNPSLSNVSDDTTQASKDNTDNSNNSGSSDEDVNPDDQSDTPNEPDDDGKNQDSGSDSDEPDPNNPPTSSCTEDGLILTGCEICMTSQDAEKFQKINDIRYEDKDNNIKIYIVRKSDIDNLYKLERGTEGEADRFTFGENGYKTINGYSYIEYAHGYYPINSATPPEFDPSAASITGYSYGYELDKGDMLVFHSTPTTYALDQFIESSVESIKDDSI